jgi:hypothetical protein
MLMLFSTVERLRNPPTGAARVLTRTKMSEHITPILKFLHWLPVIYRIDFKALLKKTVFFS